VRRPTHFCVAPSHFRRIGQAIENTGDCCLPEKRPFRPLAGSQRFAIGFLHWRQRLGGRTRSIDPRLHRINPMEAIALFFTAKDEHATPLENHASTMRRLV
jgi:hypothetical protein